jgi:hypothetical protein
MFNLTLTEKIDDSLSRGRLSYNEITKIVELDKARHEADEREDDEAIRYYGNQIKEILDRAELSAGERLSRAEKKRK